MKDMLRENQRSMNKAIREIDRERTGLQNQEKKTDRRNQEISKTRSNGRC